MKIDLLQDRALMFQKVRDFFYKKGVIEVDTPILISKPSLDLHIDLMKACGGEYLRTSAEYAMKKLLALGSPDIFELSHVFRKGEHSLKHHPEFTMIEWYRKGFSFEEMIQETCELISLFLGNKKIKRYTYRELFYTTLGVFPEDKESILLSVLLQHGITPHASLQGRDDILNVLLGCLVEPKLEKECLHIITHYPASQAANAIILPDGTAERFEIYYEDLELCNGYHELSDEKEQKRRFIEANLLREKEGKDPYPIDDEYIQLISALPDCSGVAVGFDRLFMVKHGYKDIKAAMIGHYS